MSFVFSSESVGEGHPDKVADQVSDAILDAHLRQDPMSRVACETFLCNGYGVIGGEITTTADVDVEAIARKTIERIGYTSGDRGFDAQLTPIEIKLTEQSPDIAQGTAARADQKIGAGDQGMMFGYAEAHTQDNMPLPISLAHGLTRKLAEVRHNGKLGYLRPDAKAQVSVRFSDAGIPEAIDAVVLAAQHDPDVDQKSLQEDLKEHVVRQVLPEELLHDETQFFINHTGVFVKGGPAADAGLTGRKIIVDTYGGWTPHGGGAFSGKDPTKVDRSAAYYARYVAKNLVHQGLAEKLTIQVAYSIGSLQPVSIHADSHGTGSVPDAEIVQTIRRDFSFAPGDLIDELDLRRPIYEPTAAYGHFGRPDLNLPWEAIRS